jgi:TM2 domain-containing membrane protein YozV
VPEPEPVPAEGGADIDERWLKTLADAEDWAGLRTEALRLAFRDEGTPGAARWRYYEAWGVLQQGDVQAATLRFVSLAEDGPPELAEVASLAAGRSWRTLDPEIAARRFEDLAATASPPVREQALLGLAWTEAELGQFEAAFSRLSAPPSELELALTHPRWRRAGLAALLSAGVPGAGQIYAGSPLEGLAALFVVGGLGAGTYLLAERRSWTGTAVLGTLGVSFWLGNIYGAADAATRHNRRTRQEARDQIASLEAPLWPVSPAPAPR